MTLSTSIPADHAPPVTEVYRERVDTLRGQERTLEAEHMRLGYLRLVFGIAVLVLLFFTPKWLVLLPVLGFVLAARVHQRVLARLAETRRSLTFYEHGLARVEDRWADLPARAMRVDATASLYASDLDLFGPASLFELLCEARTSLGEDVLASWLLEPAEVAVLRRRQEAVMDLRNRLNLREAFAAARGPALAQVDRPALAQWVTRQGPQLPPALRWIAPALVALTVAAGVRYALAHTPVSLMLVLLVNVTLTFSYRKSFQAIFLEAEKASRALHTLSILLQKIESQQFNADRLQKMQATLRAASHPASEAVARLAALVNWAEARGNYVVRLLDAPMLYTLQIALALQAWQRRYGPFLDAYLETLGEFEALLSIAGYSFEHPNDPFPTLVESEPHLIATGLGHPLLAEAACVRNDIALGNGTALLLVSGSNMSGKSTLLRSVGVNAVLALAGAPVRAHELELSPLTIAASIQVNDSLQAGRSRFYAEILRLRAITEKARQTGNVLFLVDEVLAGTNSSDRAVGAQGLVNDLLRHRSLGLLSTHDLALTTVASGEDRHIRNVHFEDEIVDGHLHFTYKLKQGVVERSNGLDLMRLIGLDV